MSTGRQRPAQAGEEIIEDITYEPCDEDGEPRRFPFFIADVYGKPRPEMEDYERAERRMKEVSVKILAGSRRGVIGRRAE